MEDLPLSTLAAQQGLQVQRVGRRVGMGNADGRMGIVYGLGIDVRQSLQRLFLAPDLAVHHDLALLVAPEDGLHLQNRTGQPRAAGNTPAPVQVFQVIHHEKLLHTGTKTAGKFFQFFQALALPGQSGGLNNHHSLSQRGPPGVHHPDSAFAVLFRQLLALQLHAPAAAADAAGYAQIQHILSLPQTFPHGLRRLLGVHHGGLHHSPRAHGPVEGSAVELNAPVRLRAVYLIGQGHGFYGKLVQYFHWQIRCRIRKDLYHFASLMHDLTPQPTGQRGADGH